MSSQKRLVQTLPDGHKVYHVGPRLSKKMGDIAGNHSAYPNVIRNRNEIWIADPRYKAHRVEIRKQNTTPKRLVVHEVHEDKLMRQGVPYKSSRAPSGGAHPASNQLEGRLRRGEITYSRALKLAMRKR